MTIRLIISALFILAGLHIIITALIGNFRLNYVLNRMQIGATADTLGAILMLIGIIIKIGFSMISLKLIIKVAFFWIASPVASHYLARTEVIANDKILDECEVVKK